MLSEEEKKISEEITIDLFAREKAGYTISQIAEEVGRSETSIRAHLTGKTKAGQLVRETYEKLKNRELKVVVPFVKVSEEMVEKEDLKKRIDEIKREYEEKINTLKKEVELLRQENSDLKKQLEEKENILKNIKEKLIILKDLVEYVEQV
ncbi:MAG: hypothetical protein B6U89_01705 [Desulfurococcales archaeon ex4484_58]|nr:MAG: hypothetical protein B6U89_01705 [Desulfurococcales archaeon ex4484_58]